MAVEQQQQHLRGASGSPLDAAAPSSDGSRSDSVMGRVQLVEASRKIQQLEAQLQEQFRVRTDEVATLRQAEAAARQHAAQLAESLSKRDEQLNRISAERQAEAARTQAELRALSARLLAAEQVRGELAVAHERIRHMEQERQAAERVVGVEGHVSEVKHQVEEQQRRQAELAQQLVQQQQLLGQIVAAQQEQIRAQQQALQQQQQQQEWHAAQQRAYEEEQERLAVQQQQQQQLYEEQLLREETQAAAERKMESLREASTSTSNAYVDPRETVVAPVAGEGTASSSDAAAAGSQMPASNALAGYFVASGDAALLAAGDSSRRCVAPTQSDLAAAGLEREQQKRVIQTVLKQAVAESLAEYSDLHNSIVIHQQQLLQLNNSFSSPSARRAVAASEQPQAQQHDGRVEQQQQQQNTPHGDIASPESASAETASSSVPISKQRRRDARKERAAELLVSLKSIQTELESVMIAAPQRRG